MKCEMLIGIATCGMCTGSEQSIRRLGYMDIAAAADVRGNWESLTGAR